MKPEAPPLDPKATKMKCQELVFHENIILSTLGFDFDVEQVCAHVAQLCGLLKLPKDLAKTAYVLAIYSVQLTTMCLRCPPKLEACVCLALAGELTQKGRKDSFDVLPERWYMKALGPSWKTESEKTLLSIQDMKKDFLKILMQYPSILSKLSANNGAIKRPLPQCSIKKDDNKRPKNTNRTVKTNIHPSSETKPQLCEADTSIQAEESRIKPGSSVLKTQVPSNPSLAFTKPLIEDTAAYIKSMEDECQIKNQLTSFNDSSKNSSVISLETNWTEYQRI